MTFGEQYEEEGKTEEISPKMTKKIKINLINFKKDMYWIYKSNWIISVSNVCR